MEQVCLRSFGSEPADLELDFDSGDQPDLTTRVIACCAAQPDGRRLDAADIWKLRVGRRIELLLEIAAESAALPISFTLRCRKAECQKVSEVDITLGEVLEFSAGAHEEGSIDIEFDGRAVRLRHPTGEDQLAWRQQGPRDDREAVRLAMASLLADGTGGWSAESLERLAESADAALAGHDPLVGFELTVRCPECGAESNHPIDWTEIAFARFRNAQLQLIRTVHRLASHYHWSEPEIFAVPAWRRQLYLETLEGEHA